MNYGSGIEADGIKFRCDLESPNFTVTVTHPDGRELKESWHWYTEPRYGTDAEDAVKMEQVTTKLIEELRKCSQ